MFLEKVSSIHMINPKVAIVLIMVIKVIKFKSSTFFGSLDVIQAWE